MKHEPIVLDFEAFHRLGGYTIGLDTHGMPCTPTEGYMVGIPGPHAKTQTYAPNFLNLVDQREAISRLAEKHAHKLYAGAWFDGENGTWYLDISECVPSESEALKLASSRGELAIWDVANQTEIRVNAGRQNEIIL